MSEKFDHSSTPESRHDQREKDNRIFEASDHVLTKSIVEMRLDMDGVKNVIGGLKTSVDMMDKTVTSLHKIIAGDAEFHYNGLIKIVSDEKERVTRVEERVTKRLDLHDKFFYMGSGVVCILTVLWSIFGDLIKKTIH